MWCLTDNAVDHLAMGPVDRSLVSANRIKMYRCPWYLTLVSTNHASSNQGRRSDMSARNEDKNPSPVENQFYDFKDKQPKL